jgi:hypothetical protein
MANHALRGQILGKMQSLRPPGPWKSGPVSGNFTRDDQ